LISEKDLKGGSTFFRGPHSFSVGDLEDLYVNPDPALKRGALGFPGFTAFIPVINHGAFCGEG